MWMSWGARGSRAKNAAEPSCTGTTWVVTARSATATSICRVHCVVSASTAVTATRSTCKRNTTWRTVSCYGGLCRGPPMSDLLGNSLVVSRENMIKKRNIELAGLTKDTYLGGRIVRCPQQLASEVRFVFLNGCTLPGRTC